MGSEKPGSGRFSYFRSSPGRVFFGGDHHSIVIERLFPLENLRSVVIMVEANDATLKRTPTAGTRLRKAITEHPEFVYGDDVPTDVQSLPRALGADLLAAGATAFAISPGIVICDKAVCDAACNRYSMSESIQYSLRSMVLRPGTFFGGRAFALVCGIYTLTCARSPSPYSHTHRRSPPFSGTPHLI